MYSRTALHGHPTAPEPCKMHKKAFTQICCFILAAH